MYVEADFLTALIKADDWLQDAAIRALGEYDNIHTSILAYAEVLVLFYDREAASTISMRHGRLPICLNWSPSISRNTRTRCLPRRRSLMSMI